MPVTDIGQIAKSAIEVALAIAKGSGEITAERAEKLLYALEADLKEVWTPGARAPISAIVEVTKTVDGKPRPAGDFLVVGDPDKVDTWHLPVKKNGVPNHRLMAAARAALTSPGGFRGNKYQGPDKQKAISKLKALYKSEGMEWGESASEAENILADLDALRERVASWLEVGGEEVAEVDLAESASGTVIELAEAGAQADPLKLHVAVIAPGFGNKKDNHYYPPDMLRRDAGVFEGVKMYATDHRQEEKSVRTEVSQILDCPVGFTEKGEPIALVGVFDEDFAANVRNREALGTLDSLHCSILARGKVKAGEVDGRKANVVEAITSAQSVDWVTQAGAGGHALNLAESETEGGSVMSEVENVAEETSEVEETQTEEVTLAEGEQEREQEAPQTLAESEVERLVAETNLPEAFKKALGAVRYADEDAAKSAIAEAIAEVKKLTGSGKPFGQGGTAPQSEPVTEKDIQELLDAVDERYGLR